MKSIMIRINDLIDQHGDYAKCKGCSLCEKIEKLRKGMERTPEERYKHLLQKGRNMKKSELLFLIEAEVPKRRIQEYLKMNSTEFYELLGSLGLLKKRKKKEVEEVKVQQSDYEELKAQGLSGKQIAKKLGISLQTLYNYKSKWKKASTKTVQSDTAEKKPSEGKTTQTDKTAELTALINELNDTLKEEKKKSAELETKVQELENVNAACEDVESELTSLREDKEKYLEQLLETRDQLVRKDYELQNQNKALENINKTIQRLTKENQVLKELVKAGAMAQLEFL